MNWTKEFRKRFVGKQYVEVWKTIGEKNPQYTTIPCLTGDPEVLEKFISSEKKRSQREAKLEVLREVRERILGIGRYDIPKSRSVIAVIDQLISKEEKK